MSLSPPPPSSSSGCFLAGAWNHCAYQDISSGWVNIIFFSFYDNDVCVSVVGCGGGDGGNSLISQVGVGLSD